MRPLQDLKCNATIDISHVLNEALVISYTGMTYNTTSIFGIEKFLTQVIVLFRWEKFAKSDYLNGQYY